MDIFIALLGGVAGTLIVQGLLRSFRVYRAQAYNKMVEQERREELTETLDRVNAVKGVREFEDQQTAFEVQVMKDRPQTLRELDKRGMEEFNTEIQGAGIYHVLPSHIRAHVRLPGITAEAGAKHVIR